MIIKKRIATFVLCLALVLTLGGELMLSLFSVRAGAASSTYSNVLDDLQKDEAFDPSDYPDEPDDYSLQVIQIAEGANGELFVYVYRPSNSTKHLRATKINLALDLPNSENLEFSIYNLTWLNSEGVFEKYKVDNFVVSKSEERYYYLSSIYREYSEEFDGFSDNIAVKAFPVNQLWCLYYINDILIYEKEIVDVVEVTPVFSGYIRCNNYVLPFPGLTSTYFDMHFFSFKTENFDVDKIIDCEIYYKTRQVSVTGSGDHKFPLYGIEEAHEFTLYEGSHLTCTGEGILSKSYSWDRILSKDDFVEAVSSQVSDSSKLEKDLKDSEFVLSFLETEYSKVNSSIAEEYTEVTGVTLVRMHFLSEAREYNLGVVSDILDEADAPSAVDNSIKDTVDFIFLIVSLIIFFLFVWPFLSPILMPIIQAIYGFLFWLVKKSILLVFRIILFPFKLVCKLLFAK